MVLLRLAGQGPGSTESRRLSPEALEKEQRDGASLGA